MNVLKMENIYVLIIAKNIIKYYMKINALKIVLLKRNLKQKKMGNIFALKIAKMPFLLLFQSYIILEGYS